MPETITRNLMTRVEVAEYLGVPERSVRAWTEKGTGPARIKFGRHVRYDRVDVLAWVESKKVQPST